LERCLIVLGAGIHLYIIGATNNSPLDLSPAIQARVGFGVADVHYTFGGYSNVLANILVSNAIQLILSLAYIAYNTIFTYQLVSAEWDAFGLSRKPLRVTDPLGDQSSNHALGLPLTYGLPLMMFSATLHWLASESVFLFDVVAVAWDGK
jgi:hypothetical protein